MKLVLPPSNSEVLPHDDFDMLLRDYFRSEMPKPWPALPPVRSVVLKSHVPLMRESVRSRLALAASIALLIGGLLVLPGRLPLAEKAEKRMPPGEATRIKLIQPKDTSTVIRIESRQRAVPMNEARH